MRRARALVTGVGVCSSVGDERELLSAISAGVSALHMHTLPELEGFPAFPAALAAAGSPARFLEDRKLMKYMSEVSRLSVLAAGRALESAGLLAAPALRAEMGLLIATGPIAFDLDAVRPSLSACVTDRGELLGELLGEGLKRCHPLMPFKMLLNMPLGLTSIVFGLRGANGIYYPGAAAAGVPFEAALRGLDAGRFERVLVGAAIQGVSVLPVASLARLGRLAATIEACAEGHGLAPADGAAFLVLESEASARTRGAHALCALSGAASGLALAERPEARAREVVEVWARALPCAPRRVLTSSTGKAEEDAARRTALASRWDEAHLDPGLERQTGSLGAANLAFGASVAALGLGSEAWLDPVLIGCADSDGGCAAVVLERAEEQR